MHFPPGSSSWNLRPAPLDFVKPPQGEARGKTGASCDLYQPPGVTDASALEGEANLDLWRRLLGDFQVLRLSQNTFS